MSYCVELFSSSCLRLYTWHMCYIVINNHNPTEGIPTLTQWWGLCGQMILWSMLVIAWLLVWPSTPERSKVMTQTKRDTLVLQVGGWEWGWHPHPVKKYLLRCLSHSSIKVLLIEKSHPSVKLNLYILIVSGKFHGVSQYPILSVFYFKLFVKLWKSTIITVL